MLRRPGRVCIALALFGSVLRGQSAILDDLFDETPPLFGDPPIGFNYTAITRPQGRFGRISVNTTW